MSNIRVSPELLEFLQELKRQYARKTGEFKSFEEIISDAVGFEEESEDNDEESGEFDD